MKLEAKNYQCVHELCVVVRVAYFDDGSMEEFASPERIETLDELHIIVECGHSKVE